MTDQTQAIVNKYAYDPFGNIANQVEAVTQPFKFVGQLGVMTEPNGLYYMRARYYDPDVGRFISEDPTGFDGGDMNLMAYVANNPANLVDPNGLYLFPYHFILSFTSMIVTGHDPITSLITAIGTVWADVRPGTFAPENAFWHAQAPPGFTTGATMKATADFINDQMGQSNLIEKGIGLHAGEDIGAHNYKPTTEHSFWNDLFPSPVALWNSLKQDISNIRRSEGNVSK